jgi:hypothetical protein
LRRRRRKEILERGKRLKMDRGGKGGTEIGMEMMSGARRGGSGVVQGIAVIGIERGIERGGGNDRDRRIGEGNGTGTMIGIDTGRGVATVDLETIEIIVAGSGNWTTSGHGRVRGTGDTGADHLFVVNTPLEGTEHCHGAHEIPRA